MVAVKIYTLAKPGNKINRRIQAIENWGQTNLEFSATWNFRVGGGGGGKVHMPITDDQIEQLR